MGEEARSLQSIMRFRVKLPEVAYHDPGKELSLHLAATECGRLILNETVFISEQRCIRTPGSRDL
jgi:hypothetical protein